MESILFSISLLPVEDILEALLVRCAGCVLAVEPGLALPLLLGLGQLRDVAVVKPEHHHPQILCILNMMSLPGLALLLVAGAVVLVPGQYGQVGALADPGSGALLSVQC